ncbi:hypothetical protein NPS01_06250 [Nocardioides psychrotolerans]|nr:hypothetical protein NPS01_06250 [Nocardioides psychrotolerans]
MHPLGGRGDGHACTQGAEQAGGGETYATGGPCAGHEGRATSEIERGGHCRQRTGHRHILVSAGLLVPRPGERPEPPLGRRTSQGEQVESGQPDHDLRLVDAEQRRDAAW